jgi:hypothetical protein
VKRKSEEGGQFNFMSLGKVIQEELARFRSVAVVGWKNKSFTLFGQKVELPLLNLDAPAISDFRFRGR